MEHLVGWHGSCQFKLFCLQLVSLFWWLKILCCASRPLDAHGIFNYLSVCLVKRCRDPGIAESFSYAGIGFHRSIARGKFKGGIFLLSEHLLLGRILICEWTRVGRGEMGPRYAYLHHSPASSFYLLFFHFVHNIYSSLITPSTLPNLSPCCHEECWCASCHFPSLVASPLRRGPCFCHAGFCLPVLSSFEIQSAKWSRESITGPLRSSSPIGHNSR